MLPLIGLLVDLVGLEPTTFCLQSRCSPSWTTGPYKRWSENYSPPVGRNSKVYSMRMSLLDRMIISNMYLMVTPPGIEPGLPPWKGDVFTAWPRGHKGSFAYINFELYINLCQLSTTKANWRLQGDLNPWPPAWQAGVLTYWTMEPYSVTLLGFEPRLLALPLGYRVILNSITLSFLWLPSFSIAKILYYGIVYILTVSENQTAW